MFKNLIRRVHKFYVRSSTEACNQIYQDLFRKVNVNLEMMIFIVHIQRNQHADCMKRKAKCIQFIACIYLLYVFYDLFSIEIQHVNI